MPDPFPNELVPEPPWEYVHRCPSCGRYFDSPSKCLPDGVMTEPVRERVPNAVRCTAMDGRCGRVAGHAGPCVEQGVADMPGFPNELVQRLQDAIHAADRELITIADFSVQEAADAIDSVRAGLKDALAETDVHAPDDARSVPDQFPAIDGIIDRLAAEAGSKRARTSQLHRIVTLDVAIEAVREGAACGVAAERARWEAKQRPRITHGRHCTCTPCARDDWTNPALAPCGMHGKDCPQEYAPLGAAGDPVPAAALSPEQTTATEPEGSGDAAR